MMRDARILAWILADPARVDQLSASQKAGVRRIADAEGLLPELEAVLDARPLPKLDMPDAVEGMVCDEAVALLGQGSLEGGLRRLWHIHQLLSLGAKRPAFWQDLVALSQQRRATRYVSRALRLSYHLFETPVDPYLAWQGQKTDIFFVGRLLARDGQGKEGAYWLRWAFRARAWWISQRRQAR